MGQLPEQTFFDLYNQFEHNFGRFFSGIAVSDAVISIARQTLRMHSLRAYDAMQFASASELRRSLQAEFSAITFVSADGDLNEVVSMYDFQIENPNDHPATDDAGTPPAR